MGYAAFNCHNHTMYSNLRMLDCIVKPEQLINRAIELGLSGIAITDHESLGSHMKVNKYAKKIRDNNPDFTIGLGNEIYLTDTRDKGQTYYHFLLIAKDKIGYTQLNKLSSQAWYNTYTDRGMERVPLLKEELKSIIGEEKGHVIADTACLGGELGTTVLELVEAEVSGDENAIYTKKLKIHNFLTFCLEIFGDDFYIEVAPATSKDQITFNKRVLPIAQAYGIKIIPGSDTHYLNKEDRYVHKAFLTSKPTEREIDSFYEFSRLMSPEEMFELLQASYSDDVISWIFENSLEVQSKISFFDLEKPQSVTEVEVKNYPKAFPNAPIDLSPYPITKALFMSDNIQERYWINQCYEGLIRKHIGYNPIYMAQLEEEARVKKIIGEKLGTCIFAYPNTLQHYIDLFWECGSTVGAGRGSACAALNHYLLDITQLDPIEWDLPFFRYLNESRVELPDVDIDLAPSRIQRIFAKIREERGELGLIQVCTYGTESTKSCILTACRGYRSEDYPQGIDVDDAQYLSSLVPVERGFVWSVSDLIYGNPEKGRKANMQFIHEVEQYPGLLDIIQGVENLISRRGIHASGVIFFDEDIFENAAIMRAPNGALTTQWDLHDQEAGGAVKYDFLLTSVQDIIIQTVDLLQQDELIEPDLLLREVYNKYLHPSVLPQDDNKMWDALSNNEVICCFQFDSPVGAQAAKKIRPHSPREMSDTNGLMRLMTGEPGEENPIDKYVRFKNNISLWYKEMDDAGLTKDEQKALEPYFLSSYGVPPSQEQLMQMVMDPKICGFSLEEANATRKVIGKKLMEKLPALHEKVVERATSKNLGRYVWQHGALPQAGYAFSKIHSLAYSFIGMQTLYLATHFNSIYWNTACLIVNSGSLEDNSEEEIVDIYEPEDDMKDGVIYIDSPDHKTKVRKVSTDYGKIAKALGDIIQAGIKVSLVDINKSGFGFKPDAENNQILFGMKGLLNVSDEIIADIINGRPYTSPKDFVRKIKPKKTAMISLIKSGAFDSMMDRTDCLIWYLWEICDKKKNLTLQNMPGLIKHNLLPEETEQQTKARRIYEFNRYLKACCKYDATYYKVDERALSFLNEQDWLSLIVQDNLLGVKTWDKIYQKWMDVFREWIAANKETILENLNTLIFMEEWDKYAKNGNISAGEMEVMCFYYHDHELKNLKREKYGIADFAKLPEEPEIEKTYQRGGKTINLYKLQKIAGTCIAKNKTKSTVTLLTPSGVVTVKDRKEHFAVYDKQISQRQPDGTKKRLEESWFNRGNMIIVTGIRRGDDFMVKKYANTPGHSIAKITSIDENGYIEVATERVQVNEI